MRHTQTVLVLAALVLLARVPLAGGQQPPQPGDQPPVPVAPPPLPELRPEPPARPLAARLQPPPADKLRVLIRTALVALNHANLTGNYSVLRDLGTPEFQRANPAARLAEVFADLRRRNIDFGPVVIVEPRLTRPPFINEQGLLYLKGFFPTRPEQVNFELAFEPIEGRWRLFGIFVDTSLAPPVAGSSGPGR